MIPMEKWEWFGHAGHLCVSYECRFHMATRVGDFWISTVGEYRPDYRGYNSDNYKLDHGEGIGIMWDGSEDDDGDLKMALFETMVFRVTGEHDCGCPDWSPSELASDRYMTHTAAQAGHVRHCMAAARGEYPMEEVQ